MNADARKALKCSAIPSARAGCNPPLDTGQNEENPDDPKASAAPLRETSGTPNAALSSSPTISSNVLLFIKI
jgi:hypothetical protein